MMISRKKKNIFNNLVLPDNLLDDGKEDSNHISNQIHEGWLQNQSPSVYKSSLQSAFQLTELIERFKLLQEKEKQANENDMFKMAALKAQIHKFTLKKRQKEKEEEKINYPSSFQLTLQKISDFFNSSYVRRCKLNEKILSIESQKEKSWKQINIQPYQFEYQQKQYTQSNQQSKKFEWVQDKTARIFLFGKNQRSYCLYGEKQTLKTILKKIQIEKIETKKMDFFHSLHKQYNQKIITLFSQNLRMYDNYNKQKIKKQTELLNKNYEESKMASERGTERFNSKTTPLLGHKRSSKQPEMKLTQSKYVTYPQSFTIQTQRPINGSESKQTSRSHLQNSTFRSRAKRSTIYYDQLENETKIIHSYDEKKNQNREAFQKKNVSVIEEQQQ